MTILRLTIAAATALSGGIHAELYLRGYEHVPFVGPAFLLQSAASFAVAMLLIAGGPAWLRFAAAALAAGALGAFTLSRTVGIAGFSERGWQPGPQTWLTLMAEILVLVLVGSGTITHSSRTWSRHRADSFDTHQELLGSGVRDIP